MSMVPARTWGPPFTVRGPAPVGEVEIRCPGCNTRFVSGQMALPRLEGGAHCGFSAHIECTERVEQLEQAV